MNHKSDQLYLFECIFFYSYNAIIILGIQGFYKNFVTLGGEH